MHPIDPRPAAEAARTCCRSTDTDGCVRPRAVFIRLRQPRACRCQVLRACRPRCRMPLQGLHSRATGWTAATAGGTVKMCAGGGGHRLHKPLNLCTLLALMQTATEAHLFLCCTRSKLKCGRQKECEVVNGHRSMPRDEHQPAKFFDSLTMPSIRCAILRRSTSFHPLWPIGGYLRNQAAAWCAPLAAKP